MHQQVEHAAHHQLAGRAVLGVSGFDSTTSGQDGRCTVLRSDGTAEWVPIDAHGRITITGCKLGRRFWDH